MKKINFSKILLLVLILLSYLFSYKYFGKRFYVFDSFGKPLGNNYFMAYELLDKSIKEKNEYTGSSDLSKYQDIFWDRFRGFVLLSDNLKGLINYRLSISEQKPLKWDTYLMKKSVFDGILYNMGIKNIGVINFVFSRSSKRVISSQGYWEALNELNNNYIYGLSYSLGKSIEFRINKNFTLFSLADLKLMFVNNVYTINNKKVNFLEGNSDTEDFKENNYITIRIQNKFPNDKESSAIVFGGLEIVDTNGSIINTYSNNIQPLVDSLNRKYIKVVKSGYQSYIVRVDKDATKINFKLKLANNYIVKIGVTNKISYVPSSLNSYDSTYLDNNVIAFSKGNIKDFSNLKEVNFSYTIEKANFNYGISVEGKLFNAKYRLGYFRNIRISSFPNDLSENIYKSSGVFYSVFNFKIYKLFVNLIYAFANPDYYTETLFPSIGGSRTVDDIDNLGWIDEITGESYGLSIFLDRDRNNTPDFVQDFLAFDAKSSFFVPGADDNHNGIQDSTENDSYPDYEFSKDLETKRIFLTYNLFGLDINASKEILYKIVSGAKSDTLFLSLKGKQNIFKFMNLSFLYKISRLQDNIPDNVVSKYDISGQNLTGDDAKDKLEFKDSLFNELYFSSRYNYKKLFFFDTDFAFKINYKYGTDNQVKEKGFINKFYLIYKATDFMDIIPKLKVLYYTMDNSKNDANYINNLTHTFLILSTKIKAGTHSYFNIGVQRWLYENKVSPLGMFNKDTIVGELIISQKYRNRQVNFTGGVKLTFMDYINNKTDNYVSSEFYFRLYSK